MGNKTSEYTLLKSRSTGKIITTGLKLYTGNFRKIFKSSWHTAAAYAAACAVLGPLLLIKLPVILQSHSSAAASEGFLAAVQMLAALAAVPVMIVIGGLLETIFYSRGISLLRKHSTTGTIEAPAGWLTFDRKAAWRTLKAMLSCLVIVAVPAIAFGLAWKFYLGARLAEPSAHIVTLALTLIIICIAAAALLPLAPISMKYLLDDGKRFWPTLGSDYPTCLVRHTGSILAVFFISLIVLAVTGCITSMPASVITMANGQAMLGMAEGDPQGMPSYITELTAAVFFIAGFLQAYVRMSVVFVVYYLHGSIETDENGRRRMTEELDTTDNQNKTL